MTHYQFYSVEDFVGDIRFRSWVRHTTPEEDAAWQEWIRENPEKRNVIEEARAIVLSIHPVQEENISDTEIQDEIQSILSKLQVDEFPKVDNSGNRRQIFRWLSIAASVSVVLFIAGWYLIRTDTHSLLAIEQSAKFAGFDIERVNKSDKPLLINLPDKSSVLLAQNSLIRYSNNFNGKTREIMLKGDAFFEVTKDETKPFYVHAGEIVAKVLGTSFEIKTNTENKQIEVTVRTGSVSVYADPLNDQSVLDDQPNIILTKNEQYIYRNDETEIQHIRLDSLSIEELSVPDTEMEFYDTKVTEVFSSLEKVYGVKFDYENAKIGACSITASFTDEPFTLKLDLICRSIGLQYEIVNDRITIKGTGCATRF